MTLWLVVSFKSSGVVEPYVSVFPYSTWLVAGSFVVQVMVAPISVVDEIGTLGMLIDVLVAGT